MYVWMDGWMDGWMDVRECVIVGGLLLGDGWGYGDEILTGNRPGASICCIKISSACDQRGAVSTCERAPLG